MIKNLTKGNISSILGVDDAISQEIEEILFKNSLSFDTCAFYLREKYNINQDKLAALKDVYMAIASLPLLNYNELNTPPLVSIIVPTYNRKSMLAECIDCLLKQSYKNIEIIIIDDCSYDGTEILVSVKYLNNKNIRYFRNSVNKNAGYSRHLGYVESNGEYIIFMDDDDYYIDKDYLLKAVKKHIEYYDIAMVGANAFIQNSINNDIFISNLNNSGYINQKEYISNFQTRFNKPFSTFTAVFKKRCMEQSELSNMQMMNDSSIYLRALLYGGAYILDDIIGVYRVHGKNITGNISVDFILDNLKEKLWVYNRLKSLWNGNLDVIWLFEQFSITIEYYINSNATNYNDIQKLKKWCFNNADPNSNKLRLIRYINKLVTKKLIKNKIIGSLKQIKKLFKVRNK